MVQKLIGTCPRVESNNLGDIDLQLTYYNIYEALLLNHDHMAKHPDKIHKIGDKTRRLSHHYNIDLSSSLHLHYSS